MTSIFLTPSRTPSLAAAGLAGTDGEGASDTGFVTFEGPPSHGRHVWGEAAGHSPSRFRRAPRLAFLGAIARRDVLFFGVLGSGVLDHRPQQRFIGRVEVGDDLPLFAVPLLQPRLVRALVVLTGELNGLQHALETELLEPVRGQVEVLKAPADLLTRQRLFAELALCRADGLGAQHRVDDAAIV